MIKQLFLKLVLLAVVLFSLSCHYDVIEPVESQKELIFSLRWIKSHNSETKDELLKTLKWNISYLGGALQKGTLNKAMNWENDVCFTIDFGKVGFSDKAKEELIKLNSIFKFSEEHKKMNGIDVGRFVMLTTNSSNHYYAISEAKRTLEGIKTTYKFANTQAAIIESGVSFGHRLISISDHALKGEDLLAFIASEGVGSILNNDFEPKEYEVIDVMSNGQLRYAIYNENGNLIPAGDPEIGISGKPSKCMWCHETEPLPPFQATTSVGGYLTPMQFRKRIFDELLNIASLREKLNLDIDYSNIKDHTINEVFYISFMEPSAERLSSEWGIPLAETLIILAEYQTHVHHEFPFLGQLYYRHEIDNLAPYKVIDVPSSSREPSSYEPDLIK